MNDDFYMRLAIKTAWQYQGLTYPNPAVGCALLDANGRLLAIEAHKKVGYAHAELSALWSAVARGSGGSGVAREVLAEVFAALLEVDKFKPQQIDELIEAILSAYSSYELPSLGQSLYIYGEDELREKAGLKRLFEIYSKCKIAADSAFLGSDFLVLCHNFILSLPTLLYPALISRAGRLGLSGGCAYVSLEPCSHTGRTPPCASLLAALGLARVVIGANDTHDIASGGTSILKAAGVSISYACESEARELLEPFKHWQLGSGFKFAKLAISINGVVSGGAISSTLSRMHMHALRTRLELLAVGGGTIRADMPRLDARLVKGNAPNVAIFSRGSSVISAPCFFVKGRDVRVQSELEFSEKFIMFEGAQGLFELLCSGALGVDMVLIYQSSEFKNGKNLSLDLNLIPIYEDRLEEDRYGWYRLKA
ncbi:bifunctional diaminohydroxyphosphoribosylaminopyrimidine deaminase/5-amino-6-(5-phosphoribosylamino)uracil reductase RibD [Campylobacter sp. 19-13652]|uniref:bifunctional diaminohydroxyphosphoribosylaminopyrimidine deaminase/5-amino-6-(5-phosphoribosylamino)uracil reductase RibD n=1 Tax=Campylobacter sp. 19-13652 TaxID=2840180 RepID=UPI001C79689D|nr:bifunctional diaminohydroxyphosphoribosylaminopyrimidine deaminase/5-amino-6-(5-phosphoribosylamino)uracil reductase RibD [Campylobacter sp. 19-13652]BCX80207.1 hypothetical protein LBC_16690 [Campylobacter sp. 19-13652]